MTGDPYCLREQTRQVIEQCHRMLDMDHHRYLSVHQERLTQSTAVITIATITILETETETETGIAIEKRCLMTWEPAAALELGTVVGPQKTQRTHESESAIPGERAVTIESRTNGTIGTSTRTGMKEAIMTVRETTVEKETGTETETENDGRTGMFKEACKTASLAEGIQS
jgi:hypothetical protein